MMQQSRVGQQGGSTASQEFSARAVSSSPEVKDMLSGFSISNVSQSGQESCGGDSRTGKPGNFANHGNPPSNERTAGRIGIPGNHEVDAKGGGARTGTGTGTDETASPDERKLDASRKEQKVDSPTPTGSFDATVTGWGTAHKVGESKEFIERTPEMQAAGVRYVGMEFLDKKGEQIAQKYLDDRAAHKSKTEQNADRKKLLDYVRGQSDSPDPQRRDAEDLIKVMEAASDHGMRVVGLEPGIDHLYSGTGRFRLVHSGLRHMTEPTRKADKAASTPQEKAAEIKAPEAPAEKAVDRNDRKALNTVTVNLKAPDQDTFEPRNSAG